MDSEDTHMNTDDSSSSDDENNELETLAEQLERKLEEDKYSYDTHVKLVDIYRKLTDLNSLRAAFERFSKCFPLTPALWLSWIRDEMKVANSMEEKGFIISLFEQAVQDYISVEMWLEYAQFAIGVFEIAKVREIINRGLNAVGVHVKEGSLLWDTLRELEAAHLSVAEAGTPDWQKQLERVFEVFRRQLSVPLLGMESTYEEFKQWFADLPEGHKLDSKTVDWGYGRAIKLLDKYRPFEDELIAAENEERLVEVYKKYVKAVTDPATVLCLYERAVVQLCLVPSVWADFCLYSMKFGDTGMAVSKRAVRNCPWSEDLWILRLRMHENLNRDEKEVLQCFEEGIASIGGQPCLELWFAYVEYVKRNVGSDDRLNKILAQAIEQVGHEGDPTSKLTRFQARVLAKKGAIGEARRLWNDILRYGRNKCLANVWLEYANLERQYGDAQQLRGLFQRAINACTDWPQFVAEEWLMFEREMGTLQDVLKCLEKSRNLKTVPNVNPATETHAHKDSKQPHGRKRPATETNGAQTSEPTEAKWKRLRTEKPERKLVVQHDPKKTVFVSNLYSSVTESELKKAFASAEKVDLVTDRKGASRCYGYVQFANEDEVETALTRDREPLKGRPMFISKCKSDRTETNPSFKYSTQSEPNKLFIKGLPMKLTKPELEQVYQPHGAVEVRLITHKSGQSKGLAYVEFADEEAAKKALAETDGMELKGHVITVAVSAPPPKKSMREKEREPVGHPRSRLQVPLVPRVVQSKAQDGGGSAKTNEEFRKMFLSS